MKKWLMMAGVGVAAMAVILVVPGGLVLVADAARRIRDKRRERVRQAEEIFVASREQTLRNASVC